MISFALADQRHTMRFPVLRVRAWNRPLPGREIYVSPFHQYQLITRWAIRSRILSKAARTGLTGQRRMLQDSPRIAATLRIPSNFIGRLILEKDDWSFVIKAHTIIEGALSRHISARINGGALENDPMPTIPFDAEGYLNRFAGAR
jgi:hypothetical protein